MPGQVLASGPVHFTDTQCRTHMIPLSALYFDKSGAIQADLWPLYSEHKLLLESWLPYLQEHGLIREGATPAPKPAMVVTAQTTGAAGNSIQLTISNLRPDTANSKESLFDANITETHTYAGLSPSTIKAVLGTLTETGSRPGLVIIDGNDPPKMPKVGSFPLIGGGVAATASMDIPNSGDTDTAFSVRARREGEDSNLVIVTIENEDVSKSTFTLVAAWTKSVTAIKADKLKPEFDYLVTIEAPKESTLAAPAEGKYSLGGGSEGPPRQPASVILIAMPSMA